MSDNLWDAGVNCCHGNKYDNPLFRIPIALLFIYKYQLIDFNEIIHYHKVYNMFGITIAR